MLKPVGKPIFPTLRNSFRRVVLVHIDRCFQVFASEKSKLNCYLKTQIMFGGHLQSFSDCLLKSVTRKWSQKVLRVANMFNWKVVVYNSNGLPIYFINAVQIQWNLIEQCLFRPKFTHFTNIHFTNYIFFRIGEYFN